MKDYAVGGIPVLFRDILPPEHDQGKWHYEGLREEKITLSAGHVKQSGSMALPCAMVYERDVAVPLRDGVRVRVDIFRPVETDSNGAKVPAVIATSPYGNSGAGYPNLEFLPFRAGIPTSKLSGYEKFEGPDPAAFVPRGYAIVNVDQRGVWDSEGDFVWNSSQEGRDGADVVEWIASQPWCSGKVGMSGNSWLVQAMWHIAAERPPHLAAIAPWEGHSDFYRESFARGGVPTGGFWELLSSWFRGRGRREDVRAMLDKYPTVNAYWEDKRAKLSQINIPAYILASYSTGLHTYGSVRGFREIDCKDKWLRFHPWQEWFDLYQEDSTEDLIKFFDRYLKGEQNGWESTPRVRLSLLRMGGRPPVINQPENEYPLARTEYRKLYLDASSLTLSPSPVPSESTASYQADNEDAKNCLELTHRFDKSTSLAGFSKLKVFVSSKDHDDLDIFVQIRKLGKDGTELCQINYPMDVLRDMAGVQSEADVPPFNIVRHLGPTGVLRASHRAMDPKLSTDFDPQPGSTHSEKIPPGTVVPIEIAFWPCGLIFDEGESLKLVIAGHQLQLKEFPDCVERNFNVGRHIVHTGGQYESFLQVPVI